MTAIRHLAISRDNSLLVAAEHKQTAHVWDLNLLKRLRTFDTTLDFGGDRLTVSNDGALLVVGAYHRHGIAAYRSSDGSELWRRKDLKKVQRLLFNHDGRCIICCFDRSAGECLDPLTGESDHKLRGVRRAWTSNCGPQYFFERASDYHLVDAGSNVAVIPKGSFAALSAAFSPTAVCISEADGPVRLFCLKSGRLIWRHNRKKGSHFLRVAYQASKDQFVGISWSFEHGGSYMLCQFDRDVGQARPLAEISSAYECVFWRNGSRLITASGTIIDVDSGLVEANLEFPMNRREESM